MQNLYALMSATALAIALAIANLYLKSAAAGESQSAFDLYANNLGKISVALILYFGVFLIYPLILRYYPINVIFPIYTGLTVLFVCMIGVFVFNEDFAFHQFLGVGFLVIGVVLISWVSKQA